eukprot:SAG22_NODE_526_length_9463_cov_8.286523_6_plen_170_part_00
MIGRAATLLASLMLAAAAAAAAAEGVWYQFDGKNPMTALGSEACKHIMKGQDCEIFASEHIEVVEAHEKEHGVAVGEGHTSLCKVRSRPLPRLPAPCALCGLRVRARPPPPAPPGHSPRVPSAASLCLLLPLLPPSTALAQQFPQCVRLTHLFRSGIGATGGPPPAGQG